jgi:hypothetical protein
MTPFLIAAAELAPRLQTQALTVHQATYNLQLRMESIVLHVTGRSVEKRNWQGIRTDLLEIAALCDAAATQLGLQSAVDAIGKEIPF